LQNKYPSNKGSQTMVAVQPVEDLKEMCQRLEEQEVEAQV
jgi:hypothetical protein